MSLAETTREAVRRHPFLYSALRAGVLNYTAAARFLSDEIGDDTDAIATALNRFSDDVSAFCDDSRDVRVTMQSGLGEQEGSEESDSSPILTVGDTGFAPDTGSMTAVLATGNVDATALAHVLSRLAIDDISVAAAAIGDESLIVVVSRRDGANAVRAVENALDSVPELGGR
ncbi:hypothetical protein SAMN05421858_1023 [Haladaptatus litoreus]|uniref:ACT domain-containing protein n=1 Tax=Haladaptatus litoreus TaxID=553468 RepID=A0A1N6X7J8_9EURY|nr:hypothetical protein [Haladaptatus litoreus]SIQ98324.1 hypothetical protein SAMN05421858_1023 [Haladaptatus litoreus]